MSSGANGSILLIIMPTTGDMTSLQITERRSITGEKLTDTMSGIIRRSDNYNHFNFKYGGRTETRTQTPE